MPTIVKPCRHGVFAFSPADVFIGRSLDLLGEYSEEEVILMCALCPAGGVAVDVGANIGCMTVPLARRANFVVAIEPQRVTFQHLCTNVTLNNLRNVVTLHAAAGERGGIVRVSQVDFDTPQNLGSAKVDDADGGDNTMMVALDELGLPACDLLKIDAEGWDGRVIAGGLRMIAAYKPVIYVEASTPEQVAGIRGQLEPLGYKGQAHRPEMFSANNFRGVAENPFPGCWNSNLLFLPDARALPDGLTLTPLS
jgi:FkbM family methyltransferase